MTSFSRSVQRETIKVVLNFLAIAEHLKWNTEIKIFIPCHPSNSPVAELGKSYSTLCSPQSHRAAGLRRHSGDTLETEVPVLRVRAFPVQQPRAHPGPGFVTHCSSRQPHTPWSQPCSPRHRPAPQPHQETNKVLPHGECGISCI